MTERITSSFSRQPARVVLVHLSSAGDIEICYKLVQVFENYFSLVCSLNGPCRLPFFGLIVLGVQSEVLLPLQHVKGNFVRIHSVLNELKASLEDGTRGWSSNQDISVVGLGIQEAVGMFQRQAQNLLVAAGYWSQLELTLFTTQQTKTVLHNLEKVTGQLDAHYLKKIQVVRIASLDQIWMSQDSQTSTSEIGDISGLIEMLSIESQMESIQSFLMSWLHDSGTDTEYLRIQFKSGFSVRCDAQERVLNSFCIPFHQNFNIGWDARSFKPVFTPLNASKQNGQSENILKLEVIQRVSIDSICDSILFGIPLILHATTCWKIDWDELETNQQHFQSLCYLLHNKKQVLITRLIDSPLEESAGTASYPNASALVGPRPSGHFLVMPSAGCSLLLKSIAVNELLLPVDLPRLDQPLEESLATVSAEFESVETAAMYNPIHMSSNLFQSLHFHLTKNLPNQRLKRKTTRAIPEDVGKPINENNQSCPTPLDAKDSSVKNRIQKESRQSCPAPLNFKDVGATNGTNKESRQSCLAPFNVKDICAGLTNRMNKEVKPAPSTGKDFNAGTASRSNKRKLFNLDSNFFDFPTEL